MSLLRELLIIARSARPARRRELVFVVSLLVMSAIADSASIVSLAFFLESSLGPGPKGMFWVFAGTIVVATGVRYASTVVLQHFGHYAARDIMVDIQDRIFGLPFEDHFSRHSKDLLAIPEKVEQTVFGILLPMLAGLGAVVTTALVIGALAWVDTGSAVIALLLVTALYGSIALMVRKRVREAGAVAAAALSERIRVTQDSLGELRDMIVDGSRPLHVARFADVATRQALAGASMAALTALPRHAGEAIGIVAVAILAAAFHLGGLDVRQALPTLGAFALAGHRLLPMAQALYQGWSSVTAGQALLREIATALSLPRPVAPTALTQSPAFRHAIELRNVSYHYPGSIGLSLTDVSLTIRKGEVIAITGSSAAGKTTLLDVVMGLLAPQHGIVTVDGQDLRGETLEAWQRQIAHVPQAPFLIDGHVAEVVTLGATSIDRDRLDRALALVGLSAEASGPVADLTIGERGIKLSGGQRQRLALARAIYRSLPVLILDEATSALDADSERHIRQALQALRDDGITIILVAHRGLLLDAADRVFTMANGRLSEASMSVEPGIEHQDRP